MKWHLYLTYVKTVPNTNSNNMITPYRSLQKDVTVCAKGKDFLRLTISYMTKINLGIIL